VPRKPPGPTAPFALFKTVGSSLEPIGCPNFKTVSGALDWAQRWQRTSRIPFALVCKRGYIIQFRISADGFVSLGDVRRSSPGPVLVRAPFNPGVVRAEPLHGEGSKVQSG